MRKFAVVLLALFLFGLGGCGSGTNTSKVIDPTTIQNPTAPLPEQTTLGTPEASNQIIAKDGGTVIVTDQNSLIRDCKIDIPAGALDCDKTIAMSIVNDPPALPMGLNFIGTPINFGPDGTKFSLPAKITIPFTDLQLAKAGIINMATLKLYSFDKTSGAWSEVKVISIDMANNVVTGELQHFSFYALVGLSGDPPKDLGTPEPGDPLFFMSTFDEKNFGWVPGHLAIYVGDCVWDGKDEKYVTAAVKRCGRYNIIEACPGVGVRKNYWRVSNVLQVGDADPLPGGYMGARTPKVDITSQKRGIMLAFYELQVGKSYAMMQLIGNVLGLLDGSVVKGPDFYDCVGLYEKGCEIAGVNDGQGIIIYDEGYVITPPWMYSYMKPAGGEEPGPTIAWLGFDISSSNYSMPTVNIKVTHPYGLSYIDDIKFMLADSDVINADVKFHDDGLDDDKVAGDGIYTGYIPVKGLSSGSYVFRFIVTDKYAKSTYADLPFYNLILTPVSGK